MLVLLGVALPLAAARVAEVSQAVALVLGAVLAVTGLGVSILVVRRRPVGSVLALAGGMSVAYLVAVTVVYPALEPRKSARPFALELKRVTAASRAQGRDVVAFDLGNIPTAIAFYSDGVYTVATDDTAVLEHHLLQDAEVFAAVNAAALGSLSQEARDRIVVHGEAKLSRRDVLLVSNTGPRAGDHPLLN